MSLYVAKQRIVVALDGLGKSECTKLTKAIGGAPFGYKIHDLWDREGPTVVTELKNAAGVDVRIWVDLKLKDIPNTVALRAAAVRDACGGIVTVHASGGFQMMVAALSSGWPLEVYAVTILTSLIEEEVHLMHGQPLKAAVLYLARLARLAGVHGIVCSPQEVGLLSKQPELKGMKFVVPGIRPLGTEAGDQKRVDTPAAAIRAGVTRLVIGRPITQATDPVAAFDAIAEEIAAAM